MIKQLLINGQVNRYTLSNRARQAISFQYITDTRTLRLIDTYNNIALDLVADGDNALTSSAMQRIWQYIQSRVDSKTGGAFKFRGNVDSLSSVLNPKAGDVYQVTLSTGQYDPDTGQLIPSSIQYNDKEYAWAEKVDPNTGLPTGGQWIELGFNYSTSGSFITEQWVKKYMQTKQQAALEHEAISTYINTISSNLETYIDQTATNLSTYVDQTATNLSSYIDDVISSQASSIETVSAAIVNYVDSVSTNITYYINREVGALSGHINRLSTQVKQQDQALSTAIDTLSTDIDTLSTSFNNLSTYVVQQDQALSTAIDTLSTTVDNLSAYVVQQDELLSTSISNLSAYVIQHDTALSTVIETFSAYVINRMDVEDGGFVTNDELEAIVDEIKAQHQQDLTIIEYDDDGNPIINP